ncbi:PREDICTED: zinc finger protein 511 [Dufourea novaeangliae]|uniref:zinc finger protein 511 n=1 Tax=Dufourea novaeangliae TaxID=178035 RepID=UPI0007675B2F|nr:PREDICTED: zinc finger protein 511 [Dufourea novaeangliae]
MEVFLQNIGVGLRPIDDPFFEDSYRACKIFQRKGVTVDIDEELCHEPIKEFPCYATGCITTFKTLVDFEMHYNSNHRYVCSECKKSLHNSRLLDIHIQETHDSFFQVLSTKQPMYQCYVSECDLKFNDPVERKDHCINIHMFPKNFRFDNASHSVKKEQKDKMEIDQPEHEKKQPKNKKPQLNKNQKTKMFMPAMKSTVPVNSIINDSPSTSSKPTNNPSSLHFVPRQVQKSYTKALTKNQSNEKNVLETECMMDLAESLPK